MLSRNISIRFIGEVKVTKDFYRNVTDIFIEKGFSNTQMYSALNMGHSTFHNFEKLKLGVSKKMAEFVKLGSEYIYANYSLEYYFNNTKNCFEKISSPTDIQFHFKGFYYGYFQKPYTIELEYFIMSFENPTEPKHKDGIVKMWSDEKNATGILVFDKRTFSITLKANKVWTNKEFFIGKKCENPDDLKYMIATWRNTKDNIYSVVCIISHIPVPEHFSKFEEIYANKAKIRQDIIKNTPAEVVSFFQNKKNKFIHLDTIHI